MLGTRDRDIYRGASLCLGSVSWNTRRGPPLPRCTDLALIPGHYSEALLHSSYMALGLMVT